MTQIYKRSIINVWQLVLSEVRFYFLFFKEVFKMKNFGGFPREAVVKVTDHAIERGGQRVVNSKDKRIIAQSLINQLRHSKLIELRPNGQERRAANGVVFVCDLKLVGPLEKPEYTIITVELCKVAARRDFSDREGNIDYRAMGAAARG